MFAARRKLVVPIAVALAAAIPVQGQEKSPAVDRYGDPLPPHAVARLGTLRFRGINMVLQAAALPGGKYVLGMGLGTTVVMWDVATGKEVRRFRAPASRWVRMANDSRLHDLHFASFAVSPDGKTLAVATADDTGQDSPICVYNLATGRGITRLPGHTSHGISEYPIVTFVSPSLLISAGDDGSVRLWDVAMKRELRHLPLPDGSRVSTIVASPNGEHIFVAGWVDKKEERFWTVWETATGKLIHREQVPGAFVKLAISPDGASLALAMGMGSPPKEPEHTEMRLYSIPEWKEHRRWKSHYGRDAGRCSVTFSPDGRTIATGGADGKVRRWDAATGKEIGPMIDPVQQHSQNVAYLDTATLITFGWQETVKFWDAKTGKSKSEFSGSELQVTALAYSPDGRHVAVGCGDSPIRVWDTKGNLIAQLRDGRSDVTGLQFSPDGKRIVSCDYHGGIRLWDWTKGGAPIKNFSNDQWEFYSVAFSPDGKTIAGGDNEGIVRVWDVSSGQCLHKLKGQAIKGELTRISSLVFTADGQSLFCSASGHGIRRWDLTTGKEAQLFRPAMLRHRNAVSQLALSPGGCWGYSSSYDGSIHVWDTAGGRLARRIAENMPPYNGPVAIAISRDGTRLAAAYQDNWEGTGVSLWDLPAGREFAVLTGHLEPVAHLAFSPDGRRLVSGSGDTTALIWDITGLEYRRKIPDAQSLVGLWKDLGANDPRIVYAAVRRAAAAGDAAVTRLKSDLKPAAAIDPETIAALVRRLDSEEFAQREKASNALAHLGPDAETSLRQALEKPESLELRLRLKQILEEQETEYRRLDNAVEILAMIGTPAARSLLVDLAKGASGSRLTRAARFALDRIEERP